jgi:AAA+ ATPase superfamily predicted ATPase
MKFYNREKEKEKLMQIKANSLRNAQLTFMIGRRRIGKTRLIHDAFSTEKYLYFFVAKKSEALLCEEFSQVISETTKKPMYGTYNHFSELFGYLLELSTEQPITLVIDEFQEFYNVNASVFSDMQRLWDSYREKSKMNLICCGSIYSLMQRIFTDKKEPLFGRANNRLLIQPFNASTMKQIMQENALNFSNKDLLAFFAITGGVPKYVEYFVENDALKFNRMLDVLLEENSLLLEEGKNVLIDEFGRDYVTYFSILSLIASSKTSRPEIESIIGSSIGVYLDKLEQEYGIIKKVRPIFDKPGSRTIKYEIQDNFLNFWFRFIFKNKSAVEIGNFSFIRQIIERDFDVFSGKMLEKYLVNQLSKSEKYTNIGCYWERGNVNEIDIVAINSDTKTIDLFEVKINPSKINLAQLKRKSIKLQQRYPDYTFSFFGLSSEDM